MYTEPGFLESRNLKAKWNEEINRLHDSYVPGFGSRFFEIDAAAVKDSGAPAAVKWFCDPAEPNFCQDADVAQQLSDWGLEGRQHLHNEYCEYTTIFRHDSTGRLRPKRVHFSTELQEYWQLMARHDPDQLQKSAAAILKRDVNWDELYGPGAGDPAALSPQQRSARFSELGAASRRAGSLNNENILFMAHPINGLDDLLYIVMFGARPFTGQQGGVPMKATREQIFRDQGTDPLACRHADPAACMAAYEQVYAGNKIAFADPLGVYIQTFNEAVFSYKDQAIPQAWINRSRGVELEIDGRKTSYFQRLEFGPPDDVDVFLDDIVDLAVASEPRLTGGYQLARQLEVGPYVKIQKLETPIAPQEYLVLTTSSEPMDCGQAAVCTRIAALKKRFEDAQLPQKTGPRSIG